MASFGAAEVAGTERVEAIGICVLSLIKLFTVADVAVPVVAVVLDRLVFVRRGENETDAAAGAVARIFGKRVEIGLVLVDVGGLAN